MVAALPSPAALFGAVASWEASAADATGLSGVYLRYVLSFFLSVLVGWGWRYVPTARGRHLYSIVTGALLLAYPFGPASLLHLAAPAAAVYAVMRQIRPHAGTLAWTLAFSYLIWRHVAGASGGAWKAGLVDYTGALMVLTLKVIAGAVAYQDGLRLAAEEAEEGEGAAGATGATAAAAAAPPPRRLLPYARAHALADLPTPLEWAGYCLGAGNLLSGPFFEVSDYLAYTRRTGDWSAGIPSGAGPVAAGRLAKAVSCGIAHSLLKPRFGVQALEGAPYATAGLAGRFALLWASGVTDRLKYYFAWAIAESSLIASGFAYEGPGGGSTSAQPASGRDSDGSAVGRDGAAEGAADGRNGPPRSTTSPPPPRWERHTNASFLGVELATSAAALPAFWNARTGAFLRHYVYERLTRGKRGGLRTMLATQAVAGAWHGLFPGYAMFFISSAFMFEAAKALYRYEKHAWPRWVGRSPVYRLAKWVFTAACLNYSASAFQILDAGPAWRVWEGVHFLPSLTMASIVIIAKVVPPRRRVRRAD